MSQSAIKIKNMTVAYQAKPVLWNITTDFKKGQLTAIIGPNGAGKSTLIKAIQNVEKAISGEISFSVTEGKWDSYQAVKKQVAYVPQKSSVDWDFPTTVLDVVVMGRYGHLGWFKRPAKKDYEIAKEKLELVGMAAYHSQQISQLSGGQQQRVFLARALAEEAAIYILDEPLAGVDIKTEKVIMAILRDLVAQGKSVIVVHHDLHTVEEYFDQVVFLNHEVVASGPVETAFTAENIDATYRRDHQLDEGVVGHA